MSLLPIEGGTLDQYTVTRNEAQSNMDLFLLTNYIDKEMFAQWTAPTILLACTPIKHLMGNDRSLPLNDFQPSIERLGANIHQLSQFLKIGINPGDYLIHHSEIATNAGELRQKGATVIDANKQRHEVANVYSNLIQNFNEFSAFMQNAFHIDNDPESDSSPAEKMHDIIAITSAFPLLESDNGVERFIQASGIAELTAAQLAKHNTFRSMIGRFLKRITLQGSTVNPRPTLLRDGTQVYPVLNTAECIDPDSLVLSKDKFYRLKSEAQEQGLLYCEETDCPLFTKGCARAERMAADSHGELTNIQAALPGFIDAHQTREIGGRQPNRKEKRKQKNNIE